MIPLGKITKLFWGWVFSGTGRQITVWTSLHGMANSGVAEPGTETDRPSFAFEEIVRVNFFRWGMVNEMLSNVVPFHEAPTSVFDDGRSANLAFFSWEPSCGSPSSSRMRFLEEDSFRRELMGGVCICCLRLVICSDSAVMIFCVVALSDACASIVLSVYIVVDQVRALTLAIPESAN